ncbi:MAG TPA: GAF domain-containing protein [Acidimicrobiales bacterium]|nr:GAF domain-containing protein [Acidimicrobiales bacterium]
MAEDRPLHDSECLHAGQELLGILLDQLPVAVFAIDSAGRPFYANAASHRLLGKGAEASATPEKLAEAYQARRAGSTEPYPSGHMPVVRALAGESAVVDDMEVVTAEGAIVPIEVRAAPIRDVSGEVAYAVAAFQDITERRTVERDRARLYEQASYRAQWLEAVGEVMAAIAAHHEPDEVLERVTGRARQLVKAHTATLAVPSAAGDGLVLTVVDGQHTQELRHAVLPLEGSLMGRVLTSCEALVVEDLAADPRSHRLIADLGIGPVAFVPLGVADAPPLGVIGVTRQRGESRFSDDEVALVRTFADQAAIAMDYGRAQRQLERLSVVADRERIAKDLHDGAIQSLFSVGMGLSATAGRTSDPDAAERMLCAVDELDHVIAELRTYIFSLQRGRLGGRQLVSAIQGLAKDLEAKIGVVTATELDEELASEVSSFGPELTQVVREGLSNVARHAGAATCRVRLVREGSDVLLEIDDDGGGYVPEQAHTGNGLHNLRERAEAMGGRLEIRSDSGGTTLRVVIPCARDQWPSTR